MNFENEVFGLARGQISEVRINEVLLYWYLPLDILALTETWLTSSFDTEEIEFGFRLMRHDRLGLKR